MIKIITISAAILLVAYLYRYFAQKNQIHQWRKQLQRGDKVRFFYNGRFLYGSIKQIVDNGQTLKIRYLFRGETYSIELPIKSVVPTLND